MDNNDVTEAVDLGVLRNLAGKVFVLTGKMSMKRDDMTSLIKACGGSVWPGVKFGVDYLVVGEQKASVGVSAKMRTAQRVPLIEIITEEEFVRLIADPDYIAVNFA